MVDTAKCFSLVRGRVMRVTRLDGCGQRVLGPDSQVTSDGFVSVALTANTDTGTEISVTNAAGRICILDEPCPIFKGYGVEVEFCGVDPSLIELMTGQSIVTDAAGTEGVGFRMNTDVDACASGFALEVWSNVPAAACDLNTGAAYGYFLIPFVKGGIIGDFTIGNDAVNFTMTGANSKDGSGWGVGPYDVTRDETNLPGPLNVAIDPGDHLHVELVNVAPPASSCGPGAVGIPATGATSGTPGAWTPPNSFGPETLTELTASAIVASPNTAWATGEHVVLRNGDPVHWNATAWVAGAA